MQIVQKIYLDSFRIEENPLKLLVKVHQEN